MTAMPVIRLLVLLPFAAPTKGDADGGWTGAPVPLGKDEAETIGEPAGGIGTPVPLGITTDEVALVVGKGAALELYTIVALAETLVERVEDGGALDDVLEDEVDDGAVDRGTLIEVEEEVERMVDEVTGTGK